MRATFENTVDILVRAYMNNTLKHGSCTACAVGNIIADRIGCSIVKRGWELNWFKDGERQLTYWDSVFLCDYSTKSIQRITPQNYKDEAKEQIDSTGYTFRELAKIEKAFELKSNDHQRLEKGVIVTEDEAMFNGLMSVVDVLAEIHGISLESKESAKALFVKA